MTTLAAARDSLLATFAVLRTEALDARAAGNHTDAADAWRALLDHTPEDPALALELKHDLRAGLHYPDSDPRFRRAARFLPDEAWLAHYSALYAFHGSDLDAIDARALALHARWPGEPRLDAIRGEVARHRRDWTAAERAFRTAARLHPHRTDWAAQADEAARYAVLAAQPWPTPGLDGGTRYAVSVVNLDRNPERMIEIERQFVTSQAPWHRLPAIEGSRLAASAVARLTGDAQSPRGTLGCFLSHVAAWEALLVRGDAAGLIVEDDVIPLLDLPARLAGPLDPASYDILFVNDRLTPRRSTPGLASEPLETAMQAFHPDDNAPGADGYILTAHAARTLLRWVEQDGMAGDVDWRLLAYALTPGAIAALPAHAHSRRELNRYAAAIPRPDRLRARVLTPALIRTVGVSSDREDQNRLHTA